MCAIGSYKEFTGLFPFVASLLESQHALRDIIKHFPYSTLER